MRRVALAVAVLLVLGLGGDHLPVPAPRWTPTHLPGDGPVLRDLLVCGGRWYALGALRHNGTSPAWWTSRDARRWSPLPVVPVTYHGHRHTLYAGACRGGRISALGSDVGGAHGMPRTSTWYQRGDGRLVEVDGAVELYGGPRSVGVSRIAGGTGGWLVVGDWLAASNRVGAAVWWSGGTSGFRRVAEDPALDSGPHEQATAADAVGTPGGWVLVGSRYDLGGVGVARRPMAWSSRDGRYWRRDPMRSPGRQQTLERVVAGPRGVVAVGLDGTGYAAWRRDGSTWHRIGRFGAGDAGARGDAGVQSLTVLPGGGLIATAPSGGTMALWWSATGHRWARIALPVTVSARGVTLLRAAATGHEIVLGAADGHGTRLWRTALPAD